MKLDKNLLISVGRILGLKDIQAKTLDGGTNSRTYLLEHQSSKYILRYELSPGLQLRRSLNAQLWAKSLGVKVPNVVAHNFDGDEEIFWIIEDWIDGNHFDLNSLTENEAIQTSYDLGKQFKLIHSKVVDRFGLIAPYPYSSYEEWSKINPEEVKFSENLTGPTFNNFKDYKVKLLSKLEEALLLANIGEDLCEDLRNIFKIFHYTESAKFCGGDTRTSNILISNDSVKSIIDWEWAYGGDPASHIASWSSGNKTIYLDSFIEGYESTDPKELKARVLKYELLDAVTLINVYNDMKDDKAIARTAQSLINMLKEKAWEKV